jgi:short-subunit dehydrogenase
LVLVGSLAAEAPIPHLAAYSASKAALASLAEVLILEEPPGSRAVVIEFRPGDIRTEFNARMAQASPWHRDPRLRGAWSALERHLAAGPDAEAAAASLLAAVRRGKAGVVCFGTWRQRVGVRLVNLLPSRLRWAALRRYHGVQT